MKSTAIIAVISLSVVLIGSLLAFRRQNNTSGFDRQMDHIDRQLDGVTCEVYFFESWSGYSHPVKPVRPQTYEEAIRRPGYYRAWLCAAGAERSFVMLEGIEQRSTPYRGRAPADVAEGTTFFRVTRSGDDVQLGPVLGLIETFDVQDYVSVTRTNGGAPVATVVQARVRLRYRYRYDAQGALTEVEITNADGVANTLPYGR